MKVHLHHTTHFLTYWANPLRDDNRKLLKQKQHVVYTNHAIGAINQYFKCETKDWLKQSRKRNIRDMKWLLFNLVRFNYNMDNYHLVSLVLGENFNYEVDRATVYHAFNRFDDMAGMRDIYSVNFMNKYNEIKKQL